LMTASHKYWKNTIVLHDERLEKFLKVRRFITPNPIYGVPFVRFPEWYFCPSCRKFQSISDWIKEYKTIGKDIDNISKVNMIDNLFCPAHKQKLVPARLITICKKGHIDDFPWIKWVHAKN